MKILRLLIAGLLLVCALPTQAGFEEGKIAFKTHDDKTALKELLPIATDNTSVGYAEAQSLIAYLIQRGTKIKDGSTGWDSPNYWFKLAASNGDPYAKYEIGFACQHQAEIGGDLCPDTNANSETQIRSLAKFFFDNALATFESRANIGDYRSQEYLGLMYGFGQGVSKNFEKGEYWLTKAAEQGDVKAAEYLMSMYEADASYLFAYEWQVISGAMSSIEAKYDVSDFDWNAKHLKKSDKNKAELLAKQWLKQKGKEKELEWLEAHAHIPVKPPRKHTEISMEWFKTHP